jgi:hypothetical protein
MLLKLKNIFKKPNEDNHLINSLFLASLILIFHLILIAGLSVLVLLLHGIVNYMVWILLGGFSLVAGSVYLFFRYIKQGGGKALQKIISLPEFQGKNIEINFLGGIASLKIRNENVEKEKIGCDLLPSSRQIEDSQAMRYRELTELASLLEKNLITPDEYYQAKKLLFNKKSL